MKKITLILTILILSSLPPHCLAYGVYDGLNFSVETGTAAKLKTNETGKDYLQGKIGSIVGTVLSFVGLLFLVLLIVSGILWMTASGSEKQIDKAKKTIVWALAGLIVVFASYAIVQFLGEKVTSSIESEKEEGETTEID